MIDLDPGEELTLIQDTARKFATEALNPAQRDFEATREVAADIRTAFAEIGLGALEIPEELGGAGLGAVAKVTVLEELAAGDAGSAIALDPLGAALYAVSELGGDGAVEQYCLPLLEQDRARAVLVLADEATLNIGAGTVSGTIPWVPADRVDLLAILTREGAVLVTDGLALEKLKGSGLRAAGASEIQLDNAPIAAAWQDKTGAARALARARLGAAALLCGVMRTACIYSREYAKDRVAFGKPIAHHQGLAFLIVEMNAALEGARILTQEAASRADQGRAFEVAAAQAFVEAAEQAAYIGPNALQILGGPGFMADLPVEKYMRECRALGLLYGGIDRAREDIGQTYLDCDLPIQLTEYEA